MHLPTLSWNSFLPVLHTLFFPNHWLLSHINISQKSLLLRTNEILIYFNFYTPWRTYYSRHFVCPSICSSVRLSVRSHFSTTPTPNWIKLHKWTPLSIAPTHFSRFFNLMLCQGKRGVNAKLQFLLISHSVFVKTSWNFMVILFIICFKMCSCYF